MDRQHLRPMSAVSGQPWVEQHRIDDPHVVRLVSIPHAHSRNDPAAIAPRVQLSGVKPELGKVQLSRAPDPAGGEPGDVVPESEIGSSGVGAPRGVVDDGNNCNRDSQGSAPLP